VIEPRDLTDENLERMVREYAEASMEFCRKQTGRDYDAAVRAFVVRREAIRALARWGLTVDDAYAEVAHRYRAREEG
jgi:hypothetical protein